MDLEAADRFASWFAHHLSNCKDWKWEVFDGKVNEMNKSLNNAHCTVNDEMLSGWGDYQQSECSSI